MNEELDIEDVTLLYHPDQEIKVKPKKCYNCKHRSDAFKLSGRTHYHCFHPDEEENRGFDTLRNFYDKCDKHENRIK